MPFFLWRFLGRFVAFCDVFVTFLAPILWRFQRRFCDVFFYPSFFLFLRGGGEFFCVFFLVFVFLSIFVPPECVDFEETLKRRCETKKVRFFEKKIDGKWSLEDRHM